MESPSNPYAPPTADPDGSVVIAPVDPDIVQTTFGNALIRWSTICIVAAAPSFMIGCTVTGGMPACIAAMLVGIALFAVGYAYIDTQLAWRRWMANRRARLAILWGFGIRLTISIIFPIAVMNDMIFGMLSVGALGGFSRQEQPYSEPITGPALTLVTTLLQGLLLNVEIWAVIALVYGLIHIGSRVRS